MRIATWNINSVRLRLDLVTHFLDEMRPDVLCLQETKVIADLFPTEAFRIRGYEHIALAGMKGYNGVAIVSRRPLGPTQVYDWCDRVDARHVAARVDDRFDLHCLYVPSGGDIPDPIQNPKFAHKLEFLECLTKWWPDNYRPDQPAMLVGDLNVAPLENDVWSHKQMLSVVSHTPVEVDRLGAMQASLDWIDTSRRFVPETEKLYSWWSYRARDWSAADRGRRLDHIWVTQPLGPALRCSGVLRAARGWQPKPSDHVPVWVDLEEEALDSVPHPSGR